jgi:hypothetical protein
MDTIYGPALYMNATAGTVSVKTTTGTIFGALINSHSSGTIKLWDSSSTVTAANNPVLNNTITLAAGERYLNLGGVTFSNGLVAVIGGTADITLHYR